MTARERAGQGGHDAGVNAWMTRAPRWQLSVLMGLLVAPCFVLVFRLGRDTTWTTAVLTGLLTAAICAPVLGFMVARQIRDSVVAGGPLTDVDRAVAERAARRGPVPEDDALRLAALRIAEDRAAQLGTARVRACLFGAALLLVSVVLAVLTSPWWWTAAVFWAALLAVSLVAPGRLRRRIELLRSGAR